MEDCSSCGISTRYVVAIGGTPLFTYTDADGESWNRWPIYTKTDAGELQEVNDFTAWTNVDDPKKILIMGVPVNSYENRISEGSPVIATGEMFVTGPGVVTKEKLKFEVKAPWEFRWNLGGEMVYIETDNVGEFKEELLYAMNEAPSTFQRIILPDAPRPLEQLRYVYENHPDFDRAKNVHTFHILVDRENIPVALERVSGVFDYLGGRDISIDDKITGQSLCRQSPGTSTIWIEADHYSTHSAEITLDYIKKQIELYNNVFSDQSKSLSIVFTEMDYGHGEWVSWTETGKHCYDEEEPENTVLGMMIGLYSLGLRLPATASIHTPYGYYFPETRKIQIARRPDIPNGDHVKEIISDYAAGVLAMLAIMIEAPGDDPFTIDFDEKILATDMEVSSDPFTRNIVSLARVIAHGRIPLTSMSFGGGSYDIDEDMLTTGPRDAPVWNRVEDTPIVSLALALNGSLLEAGDGGYSFVCRGITDGAKYRIPMIEPKRHFAKIQSGLRSKQDWINLDLGGSIIDLYGPYPYNNLNLPATTIGFGQWLKGRGASEVSGVCSMGHFDIGSGGVSIWNTNGSSLSSMLHSSDVNTADFDYDGNKLTVKTMNKLSELCTVSHKYNVIDISRVDPRAIFRLPADKEYIVGSNQLGDDLIDAVYAHGYSIDKSDALKSKIKPVTEYYEFGVDADGNIVAALKGTSEYLPGSPIAKMRDSYLAVLNDFKARLTGGATDALVDIASFAVPVSNGGHTYLNAKIRRSTRTISHTADGNTHTDTVYALFAGQYSYSSRRYAEVDDCDGPDNVTVGKLSVNDFVYSFDWNTPQSSSEPPYTSVSGKEICCCGVTGGRVIDYDSVQTAPPPAYQPGDDELLITYTVSTDGDEIMVKYKVLDGQGNDVTDIFSTLTIGSAFLHKAFDA